MPPNRYLVIPILNKSFRRLTAPTWYLDDDIYISALSDEDFAAIHRDATDRVKALVGNDQKCIYQEIEISATKEQVLHLDESVRFALNVFRQQRPIVTSVGLEFAKKRKTKLAEIHDLPSVHDPYSEVNSSFAFRVGINKDNVSAQFQLIRRVLEECPSAKVGVQRFNSSLLRPNLSDRIIDLAISLETLVPGRGELRHKFSIYNAVIGEPDKDSRRDAYALYKKLYDARSAVVHGRQPEDDDNVAWIDEHWDKVTNYAARSLSYYLFFLKDRKLADWKDHLLHLDLGTERAITV